MDRSRADGAGHRGRDWAAGLAIVALAILAMLPALLFEQLDRGDARFHLRWQAQYAALFWGGDYAPRWLPGMNLGFGSPAFFFYPPMTQWTASLLAPLLPGPGLVPLRIALSATLALAIGGLGVWRWLAAICADRRAAAFGGLLYIVLPYHLYVDTYHRAAIAELWAMAAAPWCLLGVAVTGRGGAGPVAVLVLAIVALFLSHAPSALLVVPFVLLYAGLLGIVRRRWREPLVATAASAVAAAIAAFYLATALTLTRFIRAEALFDGKLSPTHWLIGGGAWPDSSLVGVVLLVNTIQCAGGAAAMWLIWRRREPRDREMVSLAAMLLVVVLASALFQTIAARAFWTLPTPFARIQFPWRLLTVQTLAFAGIAALALAGAGRAWRIVVLAALPMTLLLDGAMFGYRLHREAGRHEIVPTAATLLADSRDAPEYQLGDAAALDSRFGHSDALVTGGAGAARTIARGERMLALDLAVRAPATLLLHRFAFTGWRYRIDDGAWHAAGRAGALVAVPIPAGRHRLIAELAPIPAEDAGATVSLVGTLVFAGWLFFAARAARVRARRMA